MSKRGVARVMAATSWLLSWASCSEHSGGQELVMRRDGGDPKGLWGALAARGLDGGADNSSFNADEGQR